MKKFLINVLPYLIIVAMLFSLLPSVALRIKNEHANNNVMVSLLYNDLCNKVSSDRLDETLQQYLKAGVTTVSVMEEDINAMVSRGDITCIKYNVLCHKYDEESIEMAEFIKEHYPTVAYDSYLLITKREEIREKLERMISQKYGESEYIKIDGLNGMYAYAFYNGRAQMWDITLGYDEDVLKKLSDMGYNIALIYKVKNYTKQDYVPYIQSLVKRYHVDCFNIKAAPLEYSADEVIKANYTWISDMINKNNMTLVVTENTTQLSNQKTMGYGDIFDKVMGKGGSHKVLRSFETYDDSQKDKSLYLYRANQYFNSTVDRNIRFITVTQIAPTDITYDEGTDYTLRAVKEYMTNIRALGYTVNGETLPMDYAAHRRFIGACASVLMVMMLLLMWEMLSGQKRLSLTIAALVIALLWALSSLIVPINLIRLYPSLFCLVLACFAMTVLLDIIRRRRNKGLMPTEILLAGAVLLGTLCLGLLVMGAMLSGAEYYLNNELFRGIKISLIAPPLYTAVAFYIMYIEEKKDIRVFLNKIKLAMQAQIKVYWVVLALVFGALGMYYLRRSGNVNSISSLESAMRTAITHLFPARPRTKEFLIGYPSLVLLIFYVRKTDNRLLQWIFAIGTAVLASSIVNTSCHVFADLSVIYGRVANGLLLGTVISIFVYVANMALVRIAERLEKRFSEIL